MTSSSGSCDAGRKLKVILSLAKTFRHQMTDDAVDLVVESLEYYSAEAVEKAAKVMIRNETKFCVASLVDIIAQFNFDDRPETIGRIVVVSEKRARYLFWRQEAGDDGLSFDSMTPAERKAYVKEQESQGITFEEYGHWSKDDGI